MVVRRESSKPQVCSGVLLCESDWSCSSLLQQVYFISFVAFLLFCYLAQIRFFNSMTFQLNIVGTSI